jgi:hypothetical protein
LIFTTQKKSVFRPRNPENQHFKHFAFLRPGNSEFFVDRGVVK